MSLRRAGRPSKATIDALRVWTKGDYQKLLSATVGALLSGQTDVILIFHRLTKLPRDFPKGVCTPLEGDVNRHRCKAIKLLDWLRSRGVTDITTQTLRAANFSFNVKEKELLNGLVQP